VTSLRFGQPAPGFSLPSSGGGEASLADFKGKDVVLVFYCYDWGGI
jgi:peroxiredoxin Q/BCP